MIRRVPLAILLVLGVLAVPAAVAAAEPQLSTSAIAGKEIDVVGSGFPADADVTLVVERNGAADGSQTLHTDASGGFTATIPAGPGRGGQYRLTATAGSSTAVANVVAVETAGGLAGGTQPSAPATDTTTLDLPASSAPGSSLPGLLALALVGSLASLVFGLAASRRAAR